LDWAKQHEQGSTSIIVMSLQTVGKWNHHYHIIA